MPANLLTHLLIQYSSLFWFFLETWYVGSFYGVDKGEEIFGKSNMDANHGQKTVTGISSTPS